MSSSQAAADAAGVPAACRGARADHRAAPRWPTKLSWSAWCRSTARRTSPWPWCRASTRRSAGRTSPRRPTSSPAAPCGWPRTRTCPFPQARGMAPGNGTLVAAVAAATGRRRSSPASREAPLFHAAAKRLAADRPLVVGDRLDTDILGGNNAGFATVAVLTGVDTRESILAARTDGAPRYLIQDLTGLYAAVSRRWSTTAGRFRCGGRRHRARSGAVRISGDPGRPRFVACRLCRVVGREPRRRPTATGSRTRVARSLDWSHDRAEPRRAGPVEPEPRRRPLSLNRPAARCRRRPASAGQPPMPTARSQALLDRRRRGCRGCPVSGHPATSMRACTMPCWKP